MRGAITVIDTHIHTNRSPDGMSHWKRVLQAMLSYRLDGGAITDHDTVSKQGKMAQLAGKLNLLHIYGVELTTVYKNRFPHIVLLSANRNILNALLKNSILHPSDMPIPLMLRKMCYAATIYTTAPKLEKVVEWLSDHPEVIAVAAHPRTEVDHNRSFLRGLRADTLTSITLLELEKFVDVIQGIEVMNSLYNPHLDSLRLDFARKNNMLPFGGSDAHSAEGVGRIVTWFEGKYNNVVELLAALKTKPLGTAYRGDSKLPNW
jgi:predicted metal-dependent phosphoesterase TrpH